MVKPICKCSSCSEWSDSITIVKSYKLVGKRMVGKTERFCPKCKPSINIK